MRKPAVIVQNALRNVRKHAAHGTRAVWAVADQGINPIVQLAMTPILLRRLGRDDFGIWVLGITIIGMSQLVSCGAGMAATKHVSFDLGRGAKSEAIAATRASLTIAILGGLIAALLIWWFAPAIVAEFFSQMGNSAHLIHVLALCGLAGAIQEVDSVYAGALRGAERFDLCAKVEVPARIIMGALTVYFAARLGSVASLFAVVLIMMALKAAFKARRVAILFDEASCCLPSTERSALERALHFGVWQWLQSTGTVLFSATDQLMIGGLLGGSALTRYSVCLQLAQYVHVLPSVMMQVVFPRVSALGPALDPRQGNRILRSVTLLSMGIALTLGLPILFFASPILSIWIGADFAADNHVLLSVLVLVHIVLAFNIGAYFVLLGSGRAARSALIVVAAGAAQSAFAVVAAPFGLLIVACNRFIYAGITAFLYRAARFKPRV